MVDARADAMHERAQRRNPRAKKKSASAARRRATDAVGMHKAGRDARRRERIVQGDCEAIRLPKVDRRRVERQVEGQVAAFVLADALAVEPHLRVVVGAAKVEHDSPIAPADWHEAVALVPHEPDVLTQRRVGHQIVERRRHRHWHGVCDAVHLPSLAQPGAARVCTKAPHAVERLDLARLGGLRVEEAGAGREEGKETMEQ